MNIRKVAAVSILCVVVIAAFLIYDRFRPEPQENLKNLVSVSIEKAEYSNFKYAFYPTAGWFVDGCDVNLTVGIHSNLQSDVNVTFNVTIQSLEVTYKGYITETAFVEALQNKNVTLTAWCYNTRNQYSAEILDVQKSAR